MKKLTFLLLIAAAVLLTASPVYAQTGGAPGGNWAIPIGVGLGMGLAAGLAGLGQGCTEGGSRRGLANAAFARCDH